MPKDDGAGDAIPATIQNLKTAFRPAEFARAERALLARESNLKLEIETLKKENAKLLEAGGFHELEMLRVKTAADAAELKLTRKIAALEELLASEHKAWKALFSKVERSAAAAVVETCGGVVVKLESSEVDADVAPSLGVPKFTSEDAVLSDRDYDCAAKITETLCVKTEMGEDVTECLSLSGVERMPGVPKRRRVSSPNAHLEVGAGSDSSTCSSSTSSSDSEDDILLRSQLGDLLPKIKTREGSSSLFK